MSKIINGIFPGELYPTTTLAGCVDIYENVWPDSQKTIELIERECNNPDSGLHWSRAETISHGVNQSHRTNYNMPITHLASITDNPIASNIHNQFYIILLAAMNNYSKKYEINETFYHEGYNILKYSGGQEYRGHYDGGNTTNRCVSAICYLNSDYSGGEIEFINFNIRIKPEPGMLILFPSNYAYSHIAHPVVSGTKYAIVTWIKDS